MRPILAGLLLTFLCCNPSVAQDIHNTIESQLQQQFVGHLAVLRNFYSDSKLHYDSSGRVQGNARQGVGPIDGSIRVTKLRVDRKSIEIGGDTPIPVWDPATNAVTWGTVPWKRSLNIDAPADLNIESATALLHSLFYQPNEPATPACSAEEKARFSSQVKKNMESAYTTPAKSESKPVTNPASSLNEVPRICFPTGEVAYTNTRGVVYPKARHTPDPSYTSTGLNTRLTGHVDLMFIVNTQGQATSVIMVGKPLGAGLDEQTLKTMRSWRFDPATFNGVPVPSSVFVEFHFDLHY
jgi:TonB family protein